MTAQLPLRMDPDAFLAWGIRQERRYELVDGVVRLMAGNTRAHLRIQANLIVALRPRLRGGPCEALQEQRIVIPNRNYRYADVAVDCGPQANGDLVATGPRVTFEVESPFTSIIHEMYRLADYQTVPSIQHIVVLAQDAVRIWVWNRTDDGWTHALLEDRAAELDLPALAVSLPLAELYEGLDFPPDPAA